ncbi:hypothetical protein LPTSP3_g25290 [Leptospira kobayashii]|uniref:SH3b domain-containing protein n=1 Tax=Leptospira kobayashii TaxID=1917830 RepID=A0ABN6KGF7_9LEPT|nr:SH3 domain-containing protein [Leptospira kobayashii]BDA79599.1 hypothetical protein LPTSP3_g25290 [Leptospira kobayashii]
MWNKLIVVCLFVCSLFCGNQVEGEKEVGYDQGKKCIYASSGNQKINKISKYFHIKLDDVEKQGMDFYFLMSLDKVEFSFYSLSNNLTFPLVRVEDNVFLVPEKKVYLGLLFDKEDNKTYVWIENSKKNLFKDYEMIGSVDQKETSTTCLDRAKINSIYEGRKQEIGAGPEPDGGVFKLEVGYNRVTHDNILVRNKPDQNGKVISKLKKDSRIALLADTGIYAKIPPYGASHWVKVRLVDGRIGYVFGWFLLWEESFPDGYKLD